MGKGNDKEEGTMFEMSIKEYLEKWARGSKNAKTQYHIAQAIGETPRQVRIEIRRLCMDVDGELICSTPHQQPAGYYIPMPEDRDQAKKDIERLHRQAIRILALWQRKGQKYNRLFPTQQLNLDFTIEEGKNV